MSNNLIYFDHNATSPLLGWIKEEMDSVAMSPLNPSSVHSLGKSAKNLLSTARESLLDAVHAVNGYNAIFTSSGTEANNIALKGLSVAKRICTPIEHLSVLNVVGDATIPLGGDGIVDLEKLEALLAMLSERSASGVLLSVILANNETGVIQPISDVAIIAHKYNAIVHTDASQAFGRLPIDMGQLNVDLLTISAHKAGGPVGVGALIFKKGLQLSPIMAGGQQEYGIRPGTQNVFAIHGLGVMCRNIDDITTSFRKLEVLRDCIERRLQEFTNQVIVFGQNSPRLPNTSSIGMLGVSNETQLIHFDLHDIAISAGSACSSGTIGVPYVQVAMGYDLKEASTAVRVSLGPANTQEEAERFVGVWKSLFDKIDSESGRV
ncbi:cysteine desulfurase [Rickettsiales endosymbiont of Peranema trichophorum]|uniref:cysteine desulfurase family protein n=1 Tax=Rickettsiales endosymbiont of Peranema trichophorum TaxID=2486577 RepID=UPI001023A8ED|nr:cysteine desulfurase family protein [Rickettsiales endosymbiont of Peranema trichophorum]RZI47738.1 cysteine desulfurase [Rickettsiales endosymbiont of Peranema trichophorum]